MKRLPLILLLILWIPLTSFFRSYPSEVTYIYDADTITLEISLGLGLTKTEKVRLYGIDAPELRGAERYEGLKSRDALRKLILHKEIRLETIKNDKRGKYGRLIGVIWLGDLNVNNWLVQNDYAEERYY